MKKTANLIFQHILWRGLYFLSVLVLNILIARFFAAEKSGQIFYIVNNLAFLILLASLSLESGSIFYIASGKLEASLMGRFSALWAIGSATIAWTGWWVILHFTDHQYSTDTQFLSVCFFFILGVLLTTYFTALFYARKQFEIPNKILFGVNAVLVILLLTGSNQPFIRNHFIQIYFSCFFIQGLLLMILFFYLVPQVQNGFIPSRPILKKLLRYSLTALIANIIYFLVNRIDYWFVKKYCSPHDLGNYIQASKLGQMLLILPSILASTLFPILSSDTDEKTNAELPFTVRILFTINLLICFPMILFGHWFFPWMFGETFNEIYLLFLLLFPGILCLTANYPLTAYYSSKKIIYKNSMGSFIALAIIIIGDFLFLPGNSVYAAAVVSSLGYFAYYCFILLSYRKKYALPISDFLFLKKHDLSKIRSLLVRAEVK